MRDFSSKTLKALSSKGIQILGATFIPAEDGSFANGSRAYTVAENGVSRIWTFSQIIEASK